MIDFSKIKKLSIGGIELKQLFIGNNFTNLVPKSIDTDGSIYEGKGYIENKRLNSSGTLTNQSSTITTGFIPCKSTDLIRMSGVAWRVEASSDYLYLAFYDSSFNLLGSINCYLDENYELISSVRGKVKFKGSDQTPLAKHPTEVNGTVIFDQYEFSSDADKVAYFRINGRGRGQEMIVTINQDIVNHLIWSGGFSGKNWVKYSTESDGTTIYNNGLGYKNGYRIRSGGAEGAVSYGICTGFIPVKGGDVIRIGSLEGELDFMSTNGHASAMNAANSNFENIGQFSMQSGEYGIFSNNYKAYSKGSVVEEKYGVCKWVVPPDASGVAYIRVSCAMRNTGLKGDGSLLIVTINEEIL